MSKFLETDYVFDTSGKLVSTGSADAYILTISQQIAGYYQGLELRFKANFTNAGTATVNVRTQLAPSGLGAVTLKKNGGASNLASGDMVSGGVYTIINDGTFFQVVELNASAATVSGPSSSTDNAIARFDGTGGKTLQNSTATIDDSGNVTFSLSDDGAGAGPAVTLDRSSASPAVNDVLATITFSGRDSGGGTVNYTQISTVILDPTNASEDGELRLSARVADAISFRLSVGNGVKVGSPTGDYQGVGTINATAIYDDGVQLGVQAGTAQATTSGTEFDFTGLPANLRRITIIFDRVSLSGTDNLLVQLGDAGGLETTGYTCVSEFEGSLATSTAGFVIRTAVASRSFSGHMTLTRVTADTWVSSHAGGDDQTGAASSVGGGRKGLSENLDRVRITRTGTNTFDLGQVNILYEAS
jgi:hypothetical protein